MRPSFFLLFLHASFSFRKFLFFSLLSNFSMSCSYFQAQYQLLQFEFSADNIAAFGDENGTVTQTIFTTTCVSGQCSPPIIPVKRGTYPESFPSYNPCWAHRLAIFLRLIVTYLLNDFEWLAILVVSTWNQTWHADSVIIRYSSVLLDGKNYCDTAERLVFLLLIYLLELAIEQLLTNPLLTSQYPATKQSLISNNKLASNTAILPVCCTYPTFKLDGATGGDFCVQAVADPPTDEQDGPSSKVDRLTGETYLKHGENWLLSYLVSA